MIVLNIFAAGFSLWVAERWCERRTGPWYFNIGAAALNAGIVVAYFFR